MKNLKNLIFIVLLPIILIIILIKAQQHLRVPGQPAARPTKHDHKESDKTDTDNEHQEYMGRIQYGDYRG